MIIVTGPTVIGPLLQRVGVKRVDYPSLDKKILLVFMAISPVDRPDTHLDLISRMAKFVIHEQNRSELTAAKSPFELFQVLQKRQNS